MIKEKKNRNKMYYIIFFFFFFFRACLVSHRKKLTITTLGITREGWRTYTYVHTETYIRPDGKILGISGVNTLLPSKEGSVVCNEFTTTTTTNDDVHLFQSEREKKNIKQLQCFNNNASYSIIVYV